MKNIFTLIVIWIFLIFFFIVLFQMIFLQPWRINYNLHKEEIANIINFLDKNKDKLHYLEKNKIENETVYSLSFNDWKKCIFFDFSVNEVERKYLANSFFLRNEDIKYCDDIYDKDTINNIRDALFFMNKYDISTSWWELVIKIIPWLKYGNNNEILYYYYRKWFFKNEKCRYLWCKEIINDDIWIYKTK